MNRSHLRNRHDAERGAVAIVAAITAVVLFGMAALAVELTDMISRDRAVQTTADLAAMAGAGDLPNACAAFDSALSYLNDPDNGVLDDNGSATFSATATAMSDGNDSNGEIQVLTAGGLVIPRATIPADCSTRGRFVRVVTPPRTKKFGFAPAVGGGSRGDVRAVAIAALRGLDVSVLPLSLPSNCPSGPNYLYVDNGGGPTPSSDPNYAPRGANNGPTVLLVDPGSTANPGPLTVEVSVATLERDPALPVNAVQFDFHVLNTDGTTERRPTTGAVLGVLVAGSVTSSGSGQQTTYSARFTVALPNEVRTTSGSWKVRAQQLGGAQVRWTPDNAVGTLTVGLPSSPGCPNPANGDFGLINSPRAGNNQPAEERVFNFMFGVDHALFEVVSTETDRPCAADTNPYPDGYLDDNDPAVGNESCIDVKPGESASLPTNGLIDGYSGEPGRLEGTPGVTTSGDCRVQGDDDMQWTSNSGSDIVDTALSCYLSSGSTLTAVRNGVPDSINQSIVDDPRFFYIPITDTSFRPSNSGSQGAQFWPIKTFRAAFITNERSGGDAKCASQTDCNGLIFNNGGTQLKAIQAFTFPLSALPTEVDQPGNGGTWYGGPRDIVLWE